MLHAYIVSEYHDRSIKSIMQHSIMISIIHIIILYNTRVVFSISGLTAIGVRPPILRAREPVDSAAFPSSITPGVYSPPRCVAGPVKPQGAPHRVWTVGGESLRTYTQPYDDSMLPDACTVCLNSASLPPAEALPSYCVLSSISNVDRSVSTPRFEPACSSVVV